MREQINKVMNWKQFVNENLDNSIMVGGYKLDKKWYDQLYDENYGINEDELKDYLKILDDYQNNGGEIQRVVFSYTKPNIKNLGNSWTHINNDWKNYIRSIFDFNYEEGKINGDEGVWLIIGSTPPNNIAIQGSLEQFQNNPEEQELMILDDKKIKVKEIKKVK